MLEVNFPGWGGLAQHLSAPAFLGALTAALGGT